MCDELANGKRKDVGFSLLCSFGDVVLASRNDGVGECGVIDVNIG